MIITNPADYSLRTLNDDKFYKDKLSNVYPNSIRPRTALASPFTSVFSFGCGINQDLYFDIGQTANGGVVVGNANSRVLYEGSLYLTMHCSAFATAFSSSGSAVDIYLNLGNGTSFELFQIARAVPIALDVVLDKDNHWPFPHVSFNYLRMIIPNDGDMTYTINGIFDGVRIQY